jgi:hypothetical protein
MAKRVDLTGNKFGELTVLKKSPERLRKEKAWICKCSCGKDTVATQGQLLRGVKKSCGCLRKKSPANTLNLAGKKFGKLTAIQRAGATKDGLALWLCKCDCGGQIESTATSLKNGTTVSCGCIKQEKMAAARKDLLENKSVDGVPVPLLTKKVRSDSGTGHKGVHKRNRKGKEYYEVTITLKGKRIYVGSFKKIEDAIEARKNAEKEYHEPYIKALEEENE